MERPDRHDESLKHLFDASRRVDRGTLPAFRAVRDRAKDDGRKPSAVRLMTLGLGTLTASVALAAMAFVLVNDAYDQGPATTNAEIAKLQPPPPIEIARAEGIGLELDELEEPASGLRSDLSARENSGGKNERKTPGEAVAVAPPAAPRPNIVKRKVRTPAPADRQEWRSAPRSSPTEPTPPAVPRENGERVAVVASPDAVDLKKDSSSIQLNDEFVQDVPMPGRFYQNVLTLTPGVQDPDRDGNLPQHASRSRDFKAVVGTPERTQAPKGLDALGYVQSAAGAEFGRAHGGFVSVDQEELAEVSREGYDLIEEKGFVATLDEALSTFSIDVDTASYANVRRFLTRGQLPPRDAVRIEELINYFDYDYPEPTGGEPFSTSVEVAGCPWNEAHRLVRIGIKGREGARDENRGSNLVFLIDVSGSMRSHEKLPLLKEALRMLAGQLDARDQVAIVVYAGASGLVLPSTSGSDVATIVEALRRLEAGGGTNGGAGIDLAYRTAAEHFIRGGVNRVVLATDGDFNIGTTDRAALLKRVQQGAADGISLTALGFGMGNLQDGMLETLADKGDGNYFYIDTHREARKVLVDELQGTLVTIAKDVKIQVEFNPAEVEAYRLIGYENRHLAKQDFNDDTKDAGEIGSGHTVTALYEIVPAGGGGETRSRVDPLKYQRDKALSREAETGELLTVKLRYKRPDEKQSRLIEIPAIDDGRPFDKASADFRFAAGVAAFGLVLRDSDHRGTATLDTVIDLLERGTGPDKHGYRGEFHNLVQLAHRATPR